MPFAIAVYWLGNRGTSLTILAMSFLFINFLGLIQFWARRVHHQPNPLQHYGLEFSQRSVKEFCGGGAIGILSLLGLLLTETAFGWITWQFPNLTLGQISLEGLLMALGVGFAEELFFRGWLLDELERDYVARRALWINAIVFAILHFLKPLPEVLRTFPQFPALVILGLALVWAKRSCGDWQQGKHRDRLALAIGLHTGLVWSYYMVNVGKLVQYADRIPAWVTGIDKNPLAGAIGLIFLSLLALGMRWFAKRNQRDVQLKG